MGMVGGPGHKMMKLIKLHEAKLQDVLAENSPFCYDEEIVLAETLFDPVYSRTGNKLLYYFKPWSICRGATTWTIFTRLAVTVSRCHVFKPILVEWEGFVDPGSYTWESVSNLQNDLGIDVFTGFPDALPQVEVVEGARDLASARCPGGSTADVAEGDGAPRRSNRLRVRTLARGGVSRIPTHEFSGAARAE